MVIGASVKDTQMDVGFRTACEPFEEIADQFRLQVAYQPRPHLSIDDRSGAPAEINCGNTQGFIHGHDKISGTHDATFVAESSVKRLAQGDAHVFYRVVLVNIEIAFGFELEIKRSVAREQFQHVIEETNTR